MCKGGIKGCPHWLSLMGKLSPLCVTGAASLVQPGTDPDPRLFRRVPSPLPPPHKVTLTQGSGGSESPAPQWAWVFGCFVLWKLEEGGERVRTRKARWGRGGW